MRLRKLRNIDFAILIVSSLLWALLFVFFSSSFIAMLFGTMFILTLSALVVWRLTTAISILAWGSVFVILIDRAAGNILSYRMLLVFVAIAVMFDLLVFLVKDHLEYKTYIMIFIDGILSLLMPLLIVLAMKLDAKEYMFSILNSSIVYAIVGLLAGFLAYIMWCCIREKKAILNIKHKEFVF